MQGFFYEPKDCGAPVLYKLLRYSDEQIRAFEAYQHALADDAAHAEPAEKALSMETIGGFKTSIKYAGGDKWLRAWGDNPETKMPRAENLEIKERFKSIWPVFNPEWPIYQRDELKQW